MYRIFLTILISTSLTCICQNSTVKWVKRFGQNNTANGNEGKSLVVDSVGNVYTVGYFTGLTDFDPGSGVYNLASSGSNDVFISKLDSAGNFLWAKKIGGTGDDIGYSIGLDHTGSLVITGYFSGNVDFDPGTGIYNLSSAGGTDIFICKLDLLGNFIWAKRIGSYSADAGQSLTLDSLGNIYAVGTFYSTVDFDPGAGIYNLSGPYGAYLLKLNSLGGFVWVKQFGTSTGERIFGIGLDKNRNIHFAGTYYGTKDFNPGVGTYTMTSNGSDDMFVTKLDSSGNFIWAKSFGGPQTDQLTSLKVDELGNVYTTGSFVLTVDFDPGTNVFNMTGGTNGDIFVLKLDSSGTFLWANDFDLGIGCAIQLDSSDNVYVTGSYAGGMTDVDPSPSSVFYSSGTYDDVFVLKTTTTGSFEWFFGMNGDLSTSESANTLAIDWNGNIFVSGYFGGTVDFDPSPSVVNSITATGGMDVFIEKIGPHCSMKAPLNITPIANQSICVNSSTSLSVTSNGAVDWYSSSTSTVAIGTGSVLVISTPSAGIYRYYAIDNSCNSNAARREIIVTVSSGCQDVWPGDANSDGTANNLDVLELGLHYAQTGPPRASVSNSWQSFHADNWTGTITNWQNLNHSDCNGDGTINNGDTLAIYNNYGLTHAFKQNSIEVTNPRLSIVPNENMLLMGYWGSADIFLGDASNPITNINGVAFTVDFDNALIEQDSIYLEYTTSFIDASNQNLKFRKLNFANGKLYTATTHTNNINVSGNGKIGTLHYKIKYPLTQTYTLQIGLSQANQSDASGVITSLTSGTGIVEVINGVVGVQSLTNDNLISVSPNPAINELTVRSNSEIEKVEITNVTGQIILCEQVNSRNHKLNLENISNGVYFVKAYSNSKQITIKKLVVQK